VVAVRFVLRRLGFFVLTLWAALTLNFFIPRFMPGSSLDALFDQYPSASDADQVAIIKKVEKYMIDDVPVIPTTEGVDWFQYNTSRIGGWPTPDDPYAQPSAFIVPDGEQLLLHIYDKTI